MTTTCTACGAPDQDGAFCAVCGTPTVATPYRPRPGESSGQAENAGLEVTTEPELHGRTQRAPADMLRATAAAAAAAEPPLAGVGRRAGAYVLDLLAISLVSLVAAVATALATGVTAKMADVSAASTTMGATAATRELMGALAAVYLVAGLVSLLCWVGLAVWEGRTGRTVGNSLLGIRTVALADGGPVGVGRDLLRWLVLAACGVLPLVGTVLVLVSPTFDSSGRRQGWHDKAARSVVRDVRGGTPPSFAPASPAAPEPAGRGVVPVPGASSAEATTPDPWAFPAGQQERGGAGLITGVPGTGSAGAPEPDGDVDPATVHRTAGTDLGTAPTQVQAPVPPSVAPPSATGPVAPAAAPPSSAAPSPVAPAPAPPQRPVAAQPEPDDLEDLEATRFSVSSRRGPGDGSVPARIVVEVDPDRRVPVDGRTLVGRNPQQDGGEPAAVLRLEDPTRSVSKTHLELSPTTGGLLVTDLGSTNGSAVIAPDGTVHELRPGAPVTVTGGWVLQAGARRLTVVGPDAGA
ncbi:RDD family protein [Isoptericola sp. BMS4]|uniref:RDD family protein n=1 Tax=Isoptericola sp. BMS4 TaxID=2527875 RepID=UPI001422DF82|nr:RDD family protein [Isoptericola sp. BMS4]